MKKLRQGFERFCFRHRNVGVPNLMLFISIGTALVYLFSLFSQNRILYELFCFNRALIFKGQVWRLFTYIFLPQGDGFLMGTDFFVVAISLVCYFSLGRAMENSWGTLRFNLYYLSGILMMDIYCLIFDCYAEVYYLNLSLFLGYATMYPDSRFLLLFIIPVRARIFALIDLGLILYGLIVYPFPENLFSVISLANYFLFFGKDIVNVFPLSWRANFSRLFRKKKSPTSGNPQKPIPFPTAGSYAASTATVKSPYTHRCTVCGRTDTSDPELEFRYCSRCNGYYCYCEEHISNHEHIQ